MDWDDVIIGAATPPGGALTILRLCGPGCHAILARSLTVASPLPRQPTAQNVTFSLRAWSRTVDGLLYSWPDHRPYSGQESAEIHLPGSAPLATALQSQIIGDGARCARPGEFTLRAFLAGKLDLAQAEGVLGLIEAENIETLRQAIDQRAGGLSRPATHLRSQILDLLADLEAGLDFVDEDISFVSETELERRLQILADELQGLIQTLRHRLVDASIPTVVLVGPPNAGKSSLFNVLVGDSSAIVSPVAGTTRDTVSARGVLVDRLVEWMDTPGWDDSSDPIMVQASSQRDQVLTHADCVLHCVDASTGVVDTKIRDQVMLIRTKMDLAPDVEDPQASAHVSLHDPQSLQSLKELIRRHLDALGRESIVPITERCHASLGRAADSLYLARELAEQSAGQEYVAVALREALAELGEIVGAVYTDDLLDRIFSRFCIGK